MTLEEWKQIRYFKPYKERTPWGVANAFGDPLKMNFRLILLLDRFRKHLGLPLNIHCGYAVDGHSNNSYHYKGMAIDLSCPKMDAWTLYIQATKFGFGGLGVYPKGVWHYEGLHCDIRPGEPSTFWYTERVDGKMVYHYF